MPNRLHVKVGTIGTLVYSDDLGATFTSVNTGVNGAHLAVHGVDKIVAAGKVNNTTPSLAHSANDGTAWTAAGTPAPLAGVSYLAGVAANPVTGRWVVNGFFGGGAFYSDDLGASWTACPGSPTASSNYPKPCFANGKWFLPTGALATLYVSDDGVTFALHPTFPARSSKVVYGLGAWFVADGQGEVYRSTDFSTWTLVHSTGAGFTSIQALGGLIAYSGASGAYRAWTTDGVTWSTSGTFPGNPAQIKDFGVNEGLYYAVTNNAATVFTSPDFVTWTQVSGGWGAGEPTQMLFEYVAPASPPAGPSLVTVTPVSLDTLRYPAYWTQADLAAVLATVVS